MDLAGYFAAGDGPVRFVTASITAWAPGAAADLVTCVHGLHYVGDKLGALLRAASRLTPGGAFAANFDGALPFRYLGAGDRAGPNYTGRPAVHSYYEYCEPSAL